ncbi:MAG: hypothetical protein U0625_10260 [Phycisphaerales bacterium]
MAHWKQLTEFVVRLPHRAGELARLAIQLKGANIGVVSYFGPTEGRSADGFHIVPEDADQFREFAARIGLGTWEETCFYLSAEYRGGDLLGTLDAIAQGGINIEFIEALHVRGQFGVLIWVDDSDVDRLVHVLSAA